MQLTFATLALAVASIVSAQGVPETIKPAGAAPAGCAPDFAGSFEITVVLPSKKRSLVKRQSSCATDGTLVATLANSVLTDAKGRTGAIVANRQFQFDGPPAQAGSIYTGGFSVCTNGSLALGSSAIFYQCLSGTFYNLYDQPAGAECQAVPIEVIPCGAGGSTPASQAPDGQPAGPSATSVAAQIPDGQVQASSAGPKVTQIGDGQIQASSGLPKPVSQYTDGQIQVTAPAVSATPIVQISDGQIQATSAVTKAPVSQISDGQVQATSAVTKAPVSQISDGQIQATSAATKPPVVQISDGQVQATAASNASAPASTSPAPFTGSASTMMVGAQFVAGVAALIAVVML